MPQMMPLNWTSLMILFSLTLIMFMIMNFFIQTPNNSMNKNQFNKISIFWKW